MRGMESHHERRATGAVVISVLLAPLNWISESLDSQEDSRSPSALFPIQFFCRRGAGPVGAASARCCGRDARAFLSLRVGNMSERIDCGSQCLCRSSVAMSRAGK